MMPSREMVIDVALLGMLMAGSTLAALPTIVLVLIFQRYIVNGVRIAGMK